MNIFTIILGAITMFWSLYLISAGVYKLTEDKVNEAWQTKPIVFWEDGKQALRVYRDGVNRIKVEDLTIPTTKSLDEITLPNKDVYKYTLDTTTGNLVNEHSELIETIDYQYTLPEGSVVFKNHIFLPSLPIKTYVKNK